MAGSGFSTLSKTLGVRVLPNTAGCRTPKEAVATAQMARELFATDWIKLEVIGNDDTLQPDLFGLVEAAAILSKDGFKVFPYTTEDLVAAERLMAAGCEVLMPWGAPIGTGRGLANRSALKTLREYFPAVPLVIDAGIGAPSHAAEAMEMGYDAVLLNTAIATAADPGAHGACLCGRDRCGTHRLRGRADAAARYGRALHARRRHAVLRPGQAMTRLRGGGPDLFYPIVPDLAWLRRLVPLGVKTIQLRLKDASSDVVRREIAASLEICARHGCQLIVNDYWREALSLGADYVHLGQEDLAGADVAALKAKGVRLGISTAQPRRARRRARSPTRLCGARADL